MRQSIEQSTRAPATETRVGDQPLQPQLFDVSPRSAPEEPQRLRQGRASLGLAYALLLALVLGVVAVFVLLPRGISPSTPKLEEAANVATIAVQAPDTLKIDESTGLVPDPPEARVAAQETLAALLPQVETLQRQQVEQWGATSFETAVTAIAAGEKAYREQHFVQAKIAFIDATTKLQALTAQIPEVVQDYIDTGERALLSQDARAAQSAFSRALALAPENALAQRGLRRSDAFEQVVALLAEARGHERMGDSARAANVYRQVLKLDPDAADARLRLGKIETAQARERFNEMMSEGFRALDAAEYADAATAFQRALQQNPRSTEAANALAQTEARAAAAKIEAALAAAARAERAENWREAAAQFRAALGVDKTLANAQAGAARADQRAALVTNLDEVLKDPARFSDETVYHEAETVLKAARTIENPGPELSHRIATLSSQLIVARTKVPVRLLSDGVTDVTITKFGRVGVFNDHTLGLYPGRYTARGTRRGYRDTRLEFTVVGEVVASPITVQCEERLTFAR